MTLQRIPRGMYQDPNKNKIINGNFDIWQRDTSQTSNDYGSDDRWINGNIGSTKTHSQQTFVLGQTDVPGNPKFYSRTIVASIADAANACWKSQRIENVTTFSGQTVSLSFHAKADAAKDISIELSQHFGTSGTPSSDVTGIGAQKVSLTTSWQKFSVVVDVDSVLGKTLGTDGNDYLAVLFWFDAGSNHDSRTATLGQQSGTFDIAQVQIEDGSVGTDFEQMFIGDISKKCKRYYQSLWFDFYIDTVSSDNRNGQSIILPEEMRDTPVITQNEDIGSNYTSHDIVATDNKTLEFWVATDGSGTFTRLSFKPLELDSEL